MTHNYLRQMEITGYSVRKSIFSRKPTVTKSIFIHNHILKAYISVSHTTTATTCDYIYRAIYDGNSTVVRFYYDFGRRPDFEQLYDKFWSKYRTCRTTCLRALATDDRRSNLTCRKLSYLHENIRTF